ncbi:MAG: VWA domain-containing protein [Chloroflexi bacterium]|nr:VWA domain-containing protein [Chloroflexota bacterium]
MHLQGPRGHPQLRRSPDRADRQHDHGAAAGGPRELGAAAPHLGRTGHEDRAVTPSDATRASHADLTHNVIDFGRLLRDHAISVNPADVHDVLRSLRVIDLGDRSDFYLSLRALLLRDPDRRGPFDELFEQFWGAGPEADAMPTQEQWRTMPEAGSESMRQPEGPTYSPMVALMQKDFSDFRPDELAAVARTCVSIARRIAMRRSRRVKPTNRGSRVDPRRTIRRNLRYGGTILELARLERKIRKPRIVLICDVSRSMEQYSMFLLQFIHSMQNVIGRVESFVFSTSLHRVSSYFKRTDIMTAVDEISEEIPDWSGGTRIGESMRTFNERFARRLVDPRTVVVVLSDGLDTGETDLLGRQMAQLQARCGRLLWLNPLLGRESYEPLARGMLAALPYVDVFAAAHNLASLQRLADSIVPMRGRPAGRPARGDGNSFSPLDRGRGRE